MRIIKALQNFSNGIMHKRALLEIKAMNEQVMELCRGGEFKRAEQLANDAIARAKSCVGLSHPLTVSCIICIGFTYYLQGDYRRAQAAYEETIAFQDAGWCEIYPFLGSHIYHNLSLVHQANGDYERAFECSERSLKYVIDREATNKVNHLTGGIYLQMVQLRQQQGKYDEAIQLCEQALRLAEQAVGRKHPDIGALLHAMSGIYQDLGRYDKAVAINEEVLSILQSLPPPQLGLTAVFNDLILLCYQMGEYQQSLTYSDKAIATHLQLLPEEHPDYVLLLTNRASVFIANGDFQTARTLYDRALQIAERVWSPLHPMMAQLLNQLASWNVQIGEYTDAIGLLERAHAIQKLAGMEGSPQIADTIANLAFVYHCVGKQEVALSFYAHALSIVEKTTGVDSPGVQSICQSMADIYMERGDIEVALPLWKRSIDIDDILLGQISSIASEQRRMDFLSRLHRALSVFLSSHLSKIAQHPDARQMAFDLVLKRKSISAEVMAVQNELRLRDIYPNLRQQFDKLIELRRQIAYQTLHPGEDISSVQKQLATWHADKERLEAELARQIPEMDLRQRLQKSDRNAIALSLPEKATLVEFLYLSAFRSPNQDEAGKQIWHPARYIAFILRAGEPESIQMVDLGEAEPLDNLIATFTQQVVDNARGDEAQDIAGHNNDNEKRDDSGKNIPPGEHLYAKLIAPLMPAVSDTPRHLLIAPDGDLNLLSFAMLPATADDSSRYLCDLFRISYLSVGRDVLRFKARSEVKATAPLICVAPNYALEAPHTNENEEESKASTGGTLVEGWQFAPTDRMPGDEQLLEDLKKDLKNDIQRGGDPFAFLPASLIEGECVAGILKARNLFKEGNLFTGDTALKRVIKECKSPWILHIGTHGYFLSSKPTVAPEPHGLRAINTSLELSGPGAENPLLRSMLAFAGAKTFLKGGKLPKDAENGILTAEEITGIHLLATELVITAACKSGLGTIRMGEGVMGLRRAFMLAGARTLVMSLWNVNDLATAILMERFYQNLLKKENPMNRDKALHEAQNYVRTVTVEKLKETWLSDETRKILVANGMDKRILLKWTKSDEKECIFAAPKYWAAFICLGAIDPLPGFDMTVN